MIVQIYNLKHAVSYEIDDNIDVRHLLIDIAKHIKEPLDVLYTYSNLYEYVVGKFDLLYDRHHEQRNETYDYTIRVDYDRVRLTNLCNKHIYYITFNEIKGNCVDKLSQHVLYSEVQTLQHLLEDINLRQIQRMRELNYHNSNTFEQDFSSLTKMKETAQSIIDKINKFQENITLADYT